MKSQTGKFVIVALVAVTGLYFIARDNSPEQRIANNLGGVCGIARANVETPSRGVDRLFAHLGAHTADTLRDLGALVVEVQRIDDQKRSDERARRANRVMRAPLERCSADLDRFFAAVNADHEAADKMQRGAERLERTLNLLFGANLSELAPLRELLLKSNR